MTQMHSIKRLIGLALLAVTAASCGDVVRQGQGPVFLVVNSLQGKRGGGTTVTVGNPLLSDVVTNIITPDPCSATAPCPTIFNDLGEVTFAVAMKNVLGSEPTTNNSVTIKRYRVSYRRADGRNIPGVDVPFGFDSAATITIPGGGTATLGFEIVRHVAKMESPLAQLVSSPVIITTLADVTFFGTDQVGNDISVTASMQIDFGNFGDF
jgi:hypothetical protein